MLKRKSTFRALFTACQAGFWSTGVGGGYSPTSVARIVLPLPRRIAWLGLDGIERISAVGILVEGAFARKIRFGLAGRWDVRGQAWSFRSGARRRRRARS